MQGSGQQLLQRTLLHATERGFLGDSLTKINYKNEVSGFLSLAFGHGVQEGREHGVSMKLSTGGQGG